MNLDKAELEIIGLLNLYCRQQCDVWEPFFVLLLGANFYLFKEVRGVSKNVKCVERGWLVVVLDE